MKTNQPPPSAPVVSYKTPKFALLTVIKAGMAKGHYLWWKVAIMGFMAGMYIGVGAMLSLFLNAGTPGFSTANEPALQKFVGGAVFPIGLMLVVIAGGELFTGNVMFLSAALMAKKVTWRQLAMSWGVSYFANLAGSLFMAYFLAYLPEILHSAPYQAGLANIAVHKVENGWGVNFLRGVGCNWLVCISLFFAISADDITGKILSLWWPVMTFVTLGYEHSVANMFIIPLAMMEGANTTVGDFIARNLIPVTLGNIVGGLVFVSIAEFVVFSEFFGEHVEKMDIKTKPEMSKSRAAAAAAVGARRPPALSPSDSQEFSKSNAPSASPVNSGGMGTLASPAPEFRVEMQNITVVPI